MALNSPSKVSRPTCVDNWVHTLRNIAFISEIEGPLNLKLYLRAQTSATRQLRVFALQEAISKVSTDSLSHQGTSKLFISIPCLVFFLLNALDSSMDSIWLLKYLRFFFSQDNVLLKMPAIRTFNKRAACAFSREH